MSEVGCLKDGNFQNLTVTGNTILGTVHKKDFTNVDCSAAALQLVPGNRYYSAVVQPGDMTLPNPASVGVGARIQFVVDVVSTGSVYTFTTPGDTIFDANSRIFAGLTNATAGYTLQAAGDGTDDNTITNPHSTSRWGIGTTLEFVATDATHWAVYGYLVPSAAAAATAACTDV
jgi:hypothetical protein